MWKQSLSVAIRKNAREAPILEGGGFKLRGQIGQTGQIGHFEMRHSVFMVAFGSLSNPVGAIRILDPRFPLCPQVGQWCHRGDDNGRGVQFGKKIWRPQRDLNPRLRRERATSWAGLDDGDNRSTIFYLVSRAGFEPATHALKGRCSTN
jgi:hypothetical protein